MTGVQTCALPIYEPARIGGVRKLKIFQWGAVFLLQILIEGFTPRKKEIPFR